MTPTIRKTPSQAGEIDELRAELAATRQAVIELVGLLLPTAAGSELGLLSPRSRTVLEHNTPTCLALWEAANPPRPVRNVHNQGDELEDEPSVHRRTEWLSPVGSAGNPRLTR